MTKISSSYLALTFLLKWISDTHFESALRDQNIEYLQIDTRPSPLNTILWSANVETYDSYLLANYSFFVTKPISFVSYPKNHDLLGALSQNEKVQQMISISKDGQQLSFIEEPKDEQDGKKLIFELWNRLKGN